MKIFIYFCFTGLKTWILILTSFPVVITFLYGLKRAALKLPIKTALEPRMNDNKPKRRNPKTLPRSNPVLNEEKKDSIKENSFKLLVGTIDYVIHVFFSQGLVAYNNYFNDLTIDKLNQSNYFDVRHFLFKQEIGHSFSCRCLVPWLFRYRHGLQQRPHFFHHFPQFEADYQFDSGHSESARSESCYR